jgi:hypothetical protein
MMIKGRSGMGSQKHGRSGHSGKSPKFRHATKMEAEHNEIRDKSRIKDPKNSVAELFKK